MKHIKKEGKSKSKAWIVILLIIVAAALLGIAMLYMNNPSKNETSTTLPFDTTLATGTTHASTTLPSSVNPPITTQPTYAGSSSTTIPSTPSDNSGEDIEPLTNHSGKTYYVDIAGMKFDPLVLNIDVGDTVVWTNKDQGRGDFATVHVILSHTANFMSPRLYINNTYSYTYETAGSYPYIDSIFPKEMKKGTINVGNVSPVTGQVIRDIAGNNTPILSVLVLVAIFAFLVGHILGFRKPSEDAHVFE